MTHANQVTHTAQAMMKCAMLEWKGKEEKAYADGRHDRSFCGHHQPGDHTMLTLYMRAGGGWEEAGHVSAQSAAAQDSG